MVPKRAARRRKRNCIDTIIDGSFMGMVLAVCLAMVLGSAFFAYKGSRAESEMRCIKMSRIYIDERKPDALGNEAADNYPFPQILKEALQP